MIDFEIPKIFERAPAIRHTINDNITILYCFYFSERYF